MKKDELKQAFGGLEPTEELTKEVWTRVEKNMETVKKRKVSKIVKAAAVVLIAAGLLGGINGLSENKLVEALVSFWHVDKESQSILKDMTDYHVMVDTVYAPKLLEYTDQRIIFAGNFGVVVYNRQKQQVAATINLAKIHSNYFNAETLSTQFIVDGNKLYVYNCKKGKTYGNYYCYDLTAGGKEENTQVVSLEPVEIKEASQSMETKRKETQKGKYEETWQQFKNPSQTFDTKMYSEESLQVEEKGKKKDVCLVLDRKVGASEYKVFVFKQDHQTGKIEKEKLAVEASTAGREKKNYPRYKVDNEKSIEAAIVKCFYENPSMYEGYVYKGKEQYSQVEERRCDVAIPVIKITGEKKQGKKVKVMGAFYWYGLVVSGKTLYESDGDGSVAVINLKKTKNGYQVESVVRPRDGAYRLMDLESMFGRETKAIDQAMNVDLSPHILKKYVEQNKLDFDEYKAFGEDPKKIR